MARVRPTKFSPYARYIPYARDAYKYGKQLYQGYQTANQLYQDIKGSFSNNTMGSERNVSSGVGVTTQHDIKRQYRYKRRPRYQRRRWAKFFKKTQAVMMKSVGTNTVVRNSTIADETNAANPQKVLVANLYGHYGTDIGNECGTRDILDVINNDIGRLGTGGKVHFDTGVLDITFRSTPPSNETQSTRGMEVDVYEVLHRDDTRQSNFTGMLSQANTQTGVINTTSLSINQRGVTLFDFPALIKMSKMKILKKTKIFLPIGQTFTYQIRDPRNWVLPAAEINDNIHFVQRYRTKSVVAVFKAVVSAGGAYPAEVRLEAGVTRKYKYKIIEDSEDLDDNI